MSITLPYRIKIVIQIKIQKTINTNAVIFRYKISYGLTIFIYGLWTLNVYAYVRPEH